MTDIFSNGLAETLTIGGTIAIILASLIIGLFISTVYILTHKKEGYSANFTITLIMLPAIVAIIILLIGSNIARAFSLVGAFSLIRFRSAPGDSKDIAYAFFALGVGLACGMGYIAYAALFAVILCGTMALLGAVNFGARTNDTMKLKIVLPEDMDYQGAFDGIMDDYTESYKLTKIKSTEFGSLFELTYSIVLKREADTKKFIDALRCKNGNLNVVLGLDDTREYTTF